MSHKKSSIFHIHKNNIRKFNIFSIIINVIFLLILFVEFFIPSNLFLKYLQIFLWLYFIFEIYVRSEFHNFKKKYIFSLINILDMAVIVIIFLRFSFFDNTLLQVFTALKILRSYRIIHELSKVNKFFLYKKELIISIFNLLIFTFFMASLVFNLQSKSNPQISNFLDALYFTITTLTTTWFWDIIVTWTYWKLLVVIIMTLWVWLFLRLVSVIFRPTKIHYKCKHCWLKMHDRDASHCKHCWHIVYLETSWDQMS